MQQIKQIKLIKQPKQTNQTKQTKQTRQTRQTKQAEQSNQNPTHKLWQTIYQNKHNYKQAKPVKLQAQSKQLKQIINQKE